MFQVTNASCSITGVCKNFDKKLLPTKNEIKILGLRRYRLSWRLLFGRGRYRSHCKDMHEFFWHFQLMMFVYPQARRNNPPAGDDLRDGHEYHMRILELIELATKSEAVLPCFLRRATYVLQPLDASVAVALHQQVRP
jgi:hypothetical protein